MNKLIIRQHNECVLYQPIYRAMQSFTTNRSPDTADECWLVEHQPVFTLGQAGDLSHLLTNTDIPVWRTDRGGQITYHGPGQLMLYFMLDIKRLSLTTRGLVRATEQIIINALAELGLKASSQIDAPGVYVDDKKIAAIGLRIKKYCSYHGIAFNLDMDTQPFSMINPCGYQNLGITQLADYINPINKPQIMKLLIQHIAKELKYDTIAFESAWEPLNETS